MLIKIDADGRRFTLPIPNGLLGLGTWGVKLAAKDSGELPITPAQMRALVRELKKARRTFGRLTLVEAESADGDRVKIVL